MSETSPQRKVTLTFGGEVAAGGRVPLTLLAGKLQALQALLFHAAATVVHDRAARRGQWANRYRDAVELRFAEARPGSLVIEADLSEAGVLSDEMDLGRQAVDLAYDFAEAVERDDRAALVKRVPDRQERTTLLRSLESLSPQPNEGYYLLLGNGTAQHAGVRLTGLSRLRARLLILEQTLAATESLEEATVVGMLTKIHYDVGPQKISVRVAPGNEVDCFYDDSLRDQIANLCAGGIVEVSGFATLDAEGRLMQLDAVTGVDAVSMEPVRMARFEHVGGVHKLREPISFNVESTDGLWIYSNAGLGLWGYAARREEALRELARAFDYAYADIALAEDDALEAKAVELKRRLLALVKTDAPAEKVED